MRPIYRYKGNYPATVAPNRGDTWLPSNLQGNSAQLSAWGNESHIVTYIPQVSTPLLLSYVIYTFQMMLYNEISA